MFKPSNPASLEAFYLSAITHRLAVTRKRLINRLNFIFGSNQLSDKRVLDVGGGAGLMTLYAAVEGAEAICLEPEVHGSSKGSIHTFQQFKNSLSLQSGKAELHTTTFQDFQSAALFDIIVCCNSINHLDEQAVVSLRFDSFSQQRFIDIFSKMHAMLRSGGRMIITDCGRRNFFNDIHLRSPFMPRIEWHKHQSPHLWLDLLKQVGFRKVSLQWTSPHCLGQFGRLLLGHRLIAYFLMSHFRIEVEKPL